MAFVKGVEGREIYNFPIHTLCTSVQISGENRAQSCLVGIVSAERQPRRDVACAVRAAPALASGLTGPRSQAGCAARGHASLGNEPSRGRHARRGPRESTPPRVAPGYARAPGLPALPVVTPSSARVEVTMEPSRALIKRSFPPRALARRPAPPCSVAGLHCCRSTSSTSSCNHY
jgi:hypothetical protein